MTKGTETSLESMTKQNLDKNLSGKSYHYNIFLAAQPTISLQLIYHFN